jgi:hypothetical protein
MNQAGNSTLIVHCGGSRITRAQLAFLDTPPATRSWRPVPHHELVGELVETLTSVGVDVVREQYCTLGRQAERLLGTLDLRVPGLDSPELGVGLGLRAGNDRSTAIRFVAAARVFVCDNWAFSGSDGAVFLRKKHTSGLDLRRELSEAVGQYLSRALTFQVGIYTMKRTEITDGRAKEIIHDALADGMLPLRMFPKLHHLYFDDPEQRDKFPERSLWALNNAFTEVVKGLAPAPQEAAGVRIGRLFGRLIERPVVTVTVPVVAELVPPAIIEPPAMLALPSPARTIRTSFDPPPIPVRHLDWSAVYDGEYDGAPDAGPQLVGHGETEEAAVAELVEQRAAAAADCPESEPYQFEF